MYVCMYVCVCVIVCMCVCVYVYVCMYVLTILKSKHKFNIFVVNMCIYFKTHIEIGLGLLLNTSCLRDYEIIHLLLR